MWYPIATSGSTIFARGLAIDLSKLCLRFAENKEVESVWLPVNSGSAVREWLYAKFSGLGWMMLDVLRARHAHCVSDRGVAICPHVERRYQYQRGMACVAR